MEHNLIHLYIGDGKGKTSAAYGLALRALGCGLKVLIISFLKNDNSGELRMLKNLKNNFNYPDFYVSSKKHGFYFSISEEEKKEVQNEVSKLFDLFSESIISKKYDLIISDEIIDAVNLGLIDENKLIHLLSLRNCEVVLTGRSPSEALESIADYVSCIKKIKHPFDCGINAREGIEF